MVHICGIDSCRRIHGHTGRCNSYPSEVWGFFDSADKNKLNKTAYATPRGGKKGAYQNHVYRNNKVIVPYEKLCDCNLDNYIDGYITT